MRVFVLTTGRSGSTTFQRACSHISNFSSGHESRARKPASERIEFPDNHIEADNRLSWLLGRLDDRYGNDAYYVWLKRDDRLVSESYSKRWGRMYYIMEGYCYSILQFPIYSEKTRLQLASDYVGTVNANIKLFLKDKKNSMVFHLESAEHDFRRFWNWIGAEGDIDRALAEWEVAYNATEIKEQQNVFRKGAKKMVRLLRYFPVFFKAV